jgi:hypothetical protein
MVFVNFLVLVNIALMQKSLELASLKSKNN